MRVGVGKVGFLDILNVAYKNRKFVRRVNIAVEKGWHLSKAQRDTYDSIKGGVKFSRNPLKNLRYFVQTYKVIEKSLPYLNNQIKALVIKVPMPKQSF